MDVVSPILEKAGASYVINKLINKATNYVRDQYYWKTDLQEELQSLRRLLPQIEEVLFFAEDRLTSYEASNPALIKWMSQFRDVIDEVEEELDELEYLELEKESDSESDSDIDPIRFTIRLRTCVKKLNTSASDVEKFLALVTPTGGMGTGQMQQGILPLADQSGITSSLPLLPFKGCEEEKEKIIQYLLGESVENVHCLPLVAMGGTGKTALAQQVFDHFENVKKEHFDIKIWVCDSSIDLNASSLMKKILEYSTRQSESGPLELIPVKLKQELHSKRFLLVLDDVWDDKNLTEWEKLSAPLRYGQKGSWIILTTRLRSVAKMVSRVIRGTMEPMTLGLSKDECRSLLYELAFAGQDPNEYSPLLKIGEEIVEKLDGVPLQANSIGGVRDVVSPILETACVSYVINKLIDSAATCVRDQYNLQEEVQSLRRLLPQIQAVVGFAEDRLTMYESSNPALIQWMWQFRDVIDEAEDVLDELEYLELEKKANSDIGPSSRPAKRLRKCDDVLERLKTCVKNLKTSASDVEKFQTLVPQTGGIGTGQMQQESLTLSNQSRIISSLPGLSFKGRELEKRKIIQYLMGEEPLIQISGNVNCLPLVAMGGMGKTALAQQVFDHFENVKKKHFDIKIWVCVSSTDLDASSLMKKILEYSTRQSESGPVELIPVKLKEELQSKRFLLVLDDAWDDKNQKEWEKLCAPLLYGQKGSWILLTTRSRSVANMVSKEIRGTMEPMILQGLSEDECRSLLYERAFADQDPNGFPLLKEIGEEIVNKLNGIPLLAKSIGGALNIKLEPDHWTSISKSEVWKMPYDSKSIFIPVLTLSYMMLPSRLKRCFSYCGIFPEDYKFNKQKLVCMWVAAGLIYSDGSEGSDEDIANCCFDTLCNKSFFDVHTYNWSPFWESSFYDTKGADYYTMHDMLNGLACHVSRYECCRIVHGAPSSNLVDNAIRHISITSNNAQLPDIAKMVCKLEHLQTLLIQYYGGCQQLYGFIRDACKSPRRIRVLIVRSNDFKVSDECLNSISEGFVKLRFLEIPSSFPPSLSMHKFCFLQVLIVGENKRGGPRASLGKDANKLTNLRHLYGVHDDALLSVAEVGKLTTLQQLCFTVRTEPGYRIDELMNMDNLHQLKIKRLSNVRSLEEAKMVNLVKKRHLTRLELDWYGVSNPDINHQEVLAALQPPPTIRELVIRGYKGGMVASWMDTPSLSRLEHLELYGCNSLEELPPLWKLPCLKFLKLYQMHAIRSLGCHFSNQIDIQFPVLEELEFRDLPLWEEWNGVDDYIWFPHLKSFEIHDCPRLKKIPDLPLSIENLSMRSLELEALPRSYKCSNGSRTFGGFQQLIFLESLKIYDCPEIVHIESIGEEDDHILPSSLKTLELENIDEDRDLASYLRGLTLLTTLHFHCSPSLESLPLASEMEHLTALQDLDISDGETLTSPGGLYILKSLKTLTISDCPKFLSAEIESQEFLEEKTRKDMASSSSGFHHSVSNKAASILPSSLESLNFANSDISQESLGRCLQGLTSLEELEVSCFHHLVSLPNIEYLHNLTALRTLKIFDCKELCELESLTALASLKELHIDSCPKLLAITSSTLQNPATTSEQSATKIRKGTFPSLEEINIDNIFYLPIFPISKNLRALYIQNDIENSLVPLDFTCLPSEIEEWLLQHRESLEHLQLGHVPHLQSLPTSLESFSSLGCFYISGVPELKSLPKMPASITSLLISECSAELTKRCQENIGADWPNINHIRNISINWNEKDDKAYSYINWDSS